MKKTIGMLLVMIIIPCFTSCGIYKNSLYNEALALIDEGDYLTSYEIMEGLNGYRDSEKYADRFMFVPTMITKNRNGEKSSISFLYNEENLNTKIIETYSGGKTDCGEFTYDSHGRLISEVSTDIYGKKSTSKYSYDEYGNCIQHIETNAKGETQISTYTYGADGLTLKTKIAYFDGTESVQLFVHDDDGKLTSSGYNDSNGDYVIFDYQYDRNGNMTRITATHKPTGAQYSHAYTYDMNGNKIKHVYTMTSGKKEITNYTYNNAGWLIEEVYTSAEGEKSTYKYTYDTYGNPIKMVMKADDGTNLIIDIECKLVYIPYDLSDDVKEVHSVGFYVYS